MSKIDKLSKDCRLLILITGKLGSGKTTVAKYLEAEYGALNIAIDVIYRLLEENEYLAENNATLKAAIAGRAELSGKSIFCFTESNDSAVGFDKKIIVVEGAETEDDVETIIEFTDKTGRELIPLFIDCPYETRLERRNKKRKASGLDELSEFMIRRSDIVSEEKGMDFVEALSHTIYNGDDRNIYQLQRMIDKAILQIE